MQNEPFIAAEVSVAECTLRAIILSILLAAILAVSNAYLALKIGILTSASIPAAILSMGILRFFKNSTILENNLVQTCASTGEAVAGGIVYTIPGLIMIGYWQHFAFWQTFLISALGGTLGVLFSVPLRRVLLNDPALPFPEGRAIAQVLKAGATATHDLREIIYAGIFGAFVTFAQTGLKLIAENIQFWVIRNGVVTGFASGFSITLVAAGYLIGFELGLSLLVGAIIGWGICLPILTALHPLTTSHADTTYVVMQLWNEKIRYVGTGAMLVAGLWTLLTLLKPLYLNIKHSILLAKHRKYNPSQILRTDRDLPFSLVILGLISTLLLTGMLCYSQFPLTSLGLAKIWHVPFTLATIVYILFFGFIVCAIVGYFSGMVGVSASPGSAAIIMGIIFAAVFIRSTIVEHDPQLLVNANFNAAAMTIIIGAIITAAAAITNDNIQDLKVGQLVGATPWKQQCMLLLGVLVGSLLIPPIMQLLFNVYGIGDVLPHAGMDPSQVLAAPPAALLAAIAQAVFNHKMQWPMLALGAALATGIIILNFLLQRIYNKKISVLGVATGIYLPLTSTTPFFIGSLISLLVHKKLARTTSLTTSQQEHVKHRGLIIACGIVAGAALMNVLLTIPFALAKSPDSLRVLPSTWQWLSNVLAITVTIALAYYFLKSNSNSSPR